jgi:hemoglobin-like flavoprotein
MNANDLIRSNFALVVDRAPDLVERFYARLFTEQPQLKAMFGRRSEKAQAEMLTQALLAVVDHLEDPAWLVSTLAPMGDKHRTYGVKDEMYGLVAASLIGALKDVSGPDWNADVEAAWLGALTFVAKTMIGGTAAVAKAA